MLGETKFTVLLSFSVSSAYFPLFILNVRNRSSAAAEPVYRHQHQILFYCCVSLSDTNRMLKPGSPVWPRLILMVTFKRVDRRLHILIFILIRLFGSELMLRGDFIDDITLISQSLRSFVEWDRCHGDRQVTSCR